MPDVGRLGLVRGAVEAAVFARLVRQGPTALEVLPAAQQLMVVVVVVVVRAEIADAFRAASLTVRLFTTTGMLFAWCLPVRRKRAFGRDPPQGAVASPHHGVVEVVVAPEHLLTHNEIG
jgi:hypothetical protein